MTTTSFAGPVNAFGQAATPPGSQLGIAQDTNPHRSSSMFDQGAGLMDPRYPFAYQPGGVLTSTGWSSSTHIPVMDLVPAALATGAVAAAANVVGGTPMTLVSSTGAGVTVGASVVNALTGKLVTGLLAIGGAMGVVSPAPISGNQIWDPTKALARAVSITAAAAASGTVVFTIAGYDIYGFPMTEQITAAANTTTNGKKAWKYIASVTPATTDAHNYSVDTTDIIGFPMFVGIQAYASIWWPEPALITSSTGFTAGLTGSASTATSADVRGTYALQSASDGTKRMTMFITPSVANLSSATGLTGLAQF